MHARSRAIRLRNRLTWLVVALPVAAVFWVALVAFEWQERRAERLDVDNRTRAGRGRR